MVAVSILTDYHFSTLRPQLPANMTVMQVKDAESAYQELRP